MFDSIRKLFTRNKESKRPSRVPLFNSMGETANKKTTVDENSEEERSTSFLIKIIHYFIMLILPHSNRSNSNVALFNNMSRLGIKEKNNMNVAKISMENEHRKHQVDYMTSNKSV